VRLWRAVEGASVSVIADGRHSMVIDQYWEDDRIGFDAALNYIRRMMATKR
jgi:hypothetical protein